jgi:hypothetical protein
VVGPIVSRTVAPVGGGGGGGGGDDVRRRRRHPGRSRSRRRPGVGERHDWSLNVVLGDSHGPPRAIGGRGVSRSILDHAKQSGSARPLATIQSREPLTPAPCAQGATPSQVRQSSPSLPHHPSRSPPSDVLPRRPKHRDSYGHVRGPGRFDTAVRSEQVRAVNLRPKAGANPHERAARPGLTATENR